jgi:hypothetical protein
MKPLLAALAFAAIGAAAFAQQAYLSRSEARAALLGRDIYGVNLSNGSSWRECIDPRGHTRYVTPYGVDDGVLEIKEDGQACFRYRQSAFAEESCFFVERQGQDIRLVAPAGGDYQIVLSQPVETCVQPDHGV